MNIDQNIAQQMALMKTIHRHVFNYAIESYYSVSDGWNKENLTLNKQSPLINCQL